MTTATRHGPLDSDMPIENHPIMIRSATLQDATRLAELSAILGYPVASDDFEPRLRRIIAHPDHVVFLAEVGAGTVAGWLHGAEQEFLESGRQCEILGLVVAEEHRRHEAGRHLVTAVETWALHRGVPYITVRSNVVRAESHPFYERVGYSRVKTQHTYRKALHTLS